MPPTQCSKKHHLPRVLLDITHDIAGCCLSHSAAPGEVHDIRFSQKAYAFADSLRQHLESGTHIVTQSERRGAVLRAQADAALDFKFAAGQAQDESAYAGMLTCVCRPCTVITLGLQDQASLTSIACSPTCIHRPRLWSARHAQLQVHLYEPQLQQWLLSHTLIVLGTAVYPC